MLASLTSDAQCCGKRLIRQKPTTFTARFLVLKQAVVSVERCDPIGFCHGWVVERGVNKVLERIVGSRLFHNRLSDMHNFRGVWAEAVHTEDFERFAMEEQLEHSDRSASNLGSGETFELRMADFVGDFGGGQFAFGLADTADFRTGIDTCEDVRQFQAAT